MSVWADGVKEILDILGLEIPWRRLTAVCLVALAVIGYCDRQAFTTGVLDWAKAEACQYEHLITSAFVAPNLPKMVVVRTSSGCTVRPLREAPKQSPHAVH